MQRRLIRLFATRRELQQEILASKLQIRSRRTAFDTAKFQGFLRDSYRRNALGALVAKTARIDGDFAAFLKRYGDERGLDIRDASPDAAAPPRAPEELKKDFFGEFERQRAQLAKMDIREKVQRYEDDAQLNFPAFEHPFRLLVLSRRYTTNTTKRRRVRTCKALVFMGNGNGLIGWGKGAGGDPKNCLDKAISDCRRNLISINLDLLNTCPIKLHAKFNRHEITLWPRRQFNSWGDMTFSHMVQYAGIHHCMFKVRYDKPNGYNLVYCFFKLFTQNSTPKLLAEARGIKLYETLWARYANAGLPIAF